MKKLNGNIVVILVDVDVVVESYVFTIFILSIIILVSFNLYNMFSCQYKLDRCNLPAGKSV